MTNEAKPEKAAPAAEEPQATANAKKTKAAKPKAESAAVTPAAEENGPKKVKKDKKKGKKKDKKTKAAVIIRFDDQQLPLVDASAEALGLSRAAWVRMVVAKALAAKA